MGPRPPIKAFEGRLREDDIHLLVDYARINSILPSIGSVRGIG